jgi:hypothetical protein
LHSYTYCDIKAPMTLLAEAGPGLKKGDKISECTHLRTPDEELESDVRHPVTLDSIQNAIIEEVGARLPEVLIFQLGLGALEWYRIVPHLVSCERSPDEFYLGVPYRDNLYPLKNFPLSHALGTVAIQRRMRLEDRVLETEGIVVSGVCLDLKGNSRILGIHYASFVGKGGVANRVGVSVKSEGVSNDIEFHNMLPGRFCTGIYTEAMMNVGKGTEAHSQSYVLEGNIPLARDGKTFLLGQTSMTSGVFIRRVDPFDSDKLSVVYSNLKAVCVMPVPMILPK